MKQLKYLVLLVIGNFVNIETIFCDGQNCNCSHQINYLESELSSLKSKVSSQKNRITDVESQTYESRRRISQLERESAELTGTVSYLSATTADLKAAVGIEKILPLKDHINKIQTLQVYDDGLFVTLESIISSINASGTFKDFTQIAEMSMLNKLTELTSKVDFIPKLQDALFEKAFSAAQKNITAKNEQNQLLALKIYKNIFQKLNPIQENLYTIATTATTIEKFLTTNNANLNLTQQAKEVLADVLKKNQQLFASSKCTNAELVQILNINLIIVKINELQVQAIDFSFNIFKTMQAPSVEIIEACFNIAKYCIEEACSTESKQTAQVFLLATLTVLQKVTQLSDFSSQISALEKISHIAATLIPQSGMIIESLKEELYIMAVQAVIKILLNYEYYAKPVAINVLNQCLQVSDKGYYSNNTKMKLAALQLYTNIAQHVSEFPELCEKLLYVTRKSVLSENNYEVCEALEILEAFVKNYEKLTNADFVLYVAIKASLITFAQEEQSIQDATDKLINTIKNKGLWPRFMLFYRMTKRMKYGKVLP